MLWSGNWAKISWEWKSFSHISYRQTYIDIRVGCVCLCSGFKEDLYLYRLEINKLKKHWIDIINFEPQKWKYDSLNSTYSFKWFAFTPSIFFSPSFVMHKIYSLYIRQFEITFTHVWINKKDCILSVVSRNGTFECFLFFLSIEIGKC